jgi:hypothetical protein
MELPKLFSAFADPLHPRDTLTFMKARRPESPLLTAQTGKRFHKGALPPQKEFP